MLRSLAILCWLLSAGGAFAADFDYDHFSRLPIQHEGRIKPMDTFARIHLQRFHGTSDIDGKPAIAWLAEAMFDPADAMAQKLFLLKDADAQAMLGLQQTPDNFYSFAEATAAVAANEKLIQSLLDRPAQELTSGQRAVLDLYENTQLFTQITLSCTLFLRLNIDVPQLPLDASSPIFLDYFKYLPDLQKMRSAKNGALSQAINTLLMTIRSSKDNVLLRVIPPQWSGSDEWLSPWAMFYAGQGSPDTAKALQQWRALASSYQHKDAEGWKTASSVLLQTSEQAQDVRPAALSLELLYHRYEPLNKSMALYGIAFLLTLFCLSRPASNTYNIAVALTAIAVLSHIIGIAARIYILERPPVGTLYESLLFVSLIAALFGVYLEYRLRNRLGLLVASFAGSALLFTSLSFAADDTMGMLIAVLNTNFWLATHVLCITAGYGFSIVAALIAHIHLLMRCARSDPNKTRQVLRGGYATALIALLFASLGTILGGIWADQSWGRFWGWDPKENGALLICLWLIWVLHGRISGQLRELGFAVALAMLNIVVALSWLGVNLLSTGLHSYGFTDKAAWSLGLFCAAEISFAIFSYVMLWRSDHATAV